MTMLCGVLLAGGTPADAAAGAEVDHVLLARPTDVGVVRLPLTIDGRRREVPVRLWPHSIRAATFEVAAGGRSGVARRAAPPTPPPARTLRGAALDG